MIEGVKNMSKYPVMVYDKHGKGYGTIDFNNAMFCLRKKIASERDYLGKMWLVSQLSLFFLHALSVR